MVVFVVGKFCPMHKGHEWLLRQAGFLAYQSNMKLVVLTYTSEHSHLYPGYMRIDWIEQIVPKADIYCKDLAAPDDEDSPEIHREYCSKFLRDLGESPRYVVGSEDYIAPTAKYMATFFNCVVEPITLTRRGDYSGTKSRQHHEDLSDYVANTLKPSIAILGAESSGKTTLTKALAEHYNEKPVLEYGREFGEYNNNIYRLEDMLLIARNQIARENHTPIKRFRFCDTTPLTTAFYSNEFFNFVHPELTKLTKRKYKYTFLLDNEVPFYQDGTRNQAYRQRQLEFYEKHNHTLVTGSLEERIDKIVKILEGKNSLEK